MVVTLWRAAVVDLDQAYAGGIVYSSEQCSVRARWQRRGDGGLQWTCRRQTGSDKLGGLGGIVLPVVIGHQKHSIAVTQLERWIGQRITHSCRAETGADAAHHDSVIAAVSAENESRDDYIV